MVYVEADINVDVVCSECGTSLDVEGDGFDYETLTLEVEACSSCIESRAEEVTDEMSAEIEDLEKKVAELEGIE